MKRLIYFLLLCSMSMTIWAQDMTNVLIVELRDGNAAKFSLLNKPKISIEDMQIVVQFMNADGEYNDKSFTCSIEQFRKYYFIEEVATGIEDVKENDSKIGITYNDNQSVTISGLNGTDKLHLYSIDGRKIADIRPNDTQANISITELPAGIYVVNINSKQSFKIVKR